jgi:hypothetical protein
MGWIWGMGMKRMSLCNRFAMGAGMGLGTTFAGAAVRMKRSSGLRPRARLRIAGLVIMLVSLSLTASAADKKKPRGPVTVTYTPMPLDSGFGPMDLNEPAIPPDEIIKKFTAKETEFRAALNHYTYRRTVKVQTVTDDNKVDGEYYEVDDVTFDSTGNRMEKVVFAPAATLERITMSPADFQDIQQRLPFVLTTEALAQYDVKYIGTQKVDDVPCYVFDVSPKVMEKGKRYLQGKFWVDTEDLQIVVTSAKNVPDDVRPGHEDLSTPFTTYREQIDGKYWFPTYTKGDGILHFTGGNGYLAEDVHVRTTVKYSDYKQYGSTIKMIYEGQEVPATPDKPDSAAPQPAKPK